jgi:hypothetical protein
MEHKDFAIGQEFLCGDKRWRCTDKGPIYQHLNHEPQTSRKQLKSKKLHRQDLF